MSTAMQVVQAPISITNHPGVYKLAGTVENPDGPVNRFVHLFREERGPKAGNLWPVNLYWVSTQRSDPATGAYEFTHLSNEYIYTIKSFDPTGTYDPVIVGGKVPEPM